MIKSVTIIDYGLGNIRSLYNALKFLGYQPILYTESNKILSNVCILPGVGAFNKAIELLEAKKITSSIEDYLKNKNNTLLGICLGMQLFFEQSSENCKTTGLGFIQGKVEKLSQDKHVILPNVGYLKTLISVNKSFSYLNEFNQEKFYYIHSYAAVPAKKANQFATSTYNDKCFCAMAVKGSNIIGTQFHPEKSADIGLEFLKRLIINKIN